MVFIIGLLTALMVLTCLVLILLVLLQLPKKDAGAGLAFGGGASDALFGAGAGNVLTKITKYLAGVFFGLAVLLSILYGFRAKHSKTSISDILSAQPSKGAPAGPGAPTPAPGTPRPPAAPTPGSNLLLSTPTPESTNQPAPAAKPAPAAPASTNATPTPAAPK